MKKLASLGLALIAMIIASGLGTVPAAEVGEGHRFGEWPAINALVHDEKQQHLNPGDQDFLIEVWFKPLPKAPMKHLYSVNTLVAKKLSEKLAGYELGYTLNGDLYFSACDAGSELEGDLTVRAPCGFKDDQWYYVAAGRSGDCLRIYKDGLPVKDLTGNKLGTVSNQDFFSVSLGAMNSQAHCQIKEVRFWRVKQGAQVNFDAAVAEHGRDPAKLAEVLTANTDYSRWLFNAEGETVKDLGSNGNTLLYVPFGYHPKDEIPLKPFPAQPVGKTFFVDGANPAAADTHPGTKEQPFKTIRRGLKELRPGDVLHICKGRYFLPATLLLPRGENGKPVTIEGEQGTVLFSTAPLTGWTKTESGPWVIKDWKGNYAPPSDIREWDVRSQPGNILFAGNDVMDYVATKADLAPGCWSVEPVEGRGPKTIYLCPLPGMEPETANTEITVGGALIQTSEFNHVRNLHLTRGGAGFAVNGRGNVIENNRIDWMGGGAFGVFGTDHTIRKNRIEWTGGIGGTSTRLLFENNVLRFNAWRIVDGGWAGGAIKFIPGAIDNILRGNEFACNRTATIWYDNVNQGNIVEDNLIHDNWYSCVFDEGGFGNIFRNNIIYNNSSVASIYIANSNSDRVERNICFNNLGGIGLRGATYDAHKQPDQSRVKKAVEEITARLDVRRYQGMLTWEREKPYRDMYIKYWSPYIDAETDIPICRHNVFSENVVFDNGKGGWEDTIARYPYGQPGVVIDPDAVNVYNGNYYGCRDAELAKKGAEALAAWQKASGQEVGSSWIDPWDKEKMPEWYRKKMDGFTKDQFRPYKQVVDLTGGDIRKFSPSRLLLRERLAESKYLKTVDFENTGVRGLYFDSEGRRCLALCPRGGSEMTDWILPPGQKEILVENKWLNRTTVKADNDRISLFIMDDPTVLIGVEGEIQEDRSAVIKVPEYNEPGKPVAATIRLENQGMSAQQYELAIRGGDAWDLSLDRLAESVAAGATTEKTLTLTPKPGVVKGAYQLLVEGAAGGRKVKKIKGFIVGSRNIASKAEIQLDGDLSDWDRAKILAEVADTKDQVLLGKDAWQGPDDCSAKIRVAWQDNYQLFIGIEVVDDKLVTNHRKDKPTESDCVQVFVDVRTPWKFYENEYGVGTFQLVIVPASDDSKDPTVEFIGAPLAHQKTVVTKKTDKGYNVEVMLRFRNMDEPGWVAGREFRIGALINDCDAPAAGRKSVLGLWRTALDADRNCVSLTRFDLQE